MEGSKLLMLPKYLKRWSGRRGSNPRRPAWEAGILPLNYSRLPYFSSTYLFSKDLGRSTASLFHLLRPSKTMGLTAKWTVNQSGKPRLRRSRLLSTLLSIPRQIQNITLYVQSAEDGAPKP